jgi:acetyltransferase EpsM
MPLIIISAGSGQHAFVVWEAAIQSGMPVAGFLTAENSPNFDPDMPWLGTFARISELQRDQHVQFVVACGGNRLRKVLSERLIAKGASLISVMHPAAVVSPSAKIGPGTVLLAGAIVGSRAEIGTGVIVNHGASVGHNCSIGNYANICPGARLAGCAEVETGAFVGTNASVLQGCHLGQYSTVGAGAVVTQNVERGATVVGVPARRLRRVSDKLPE